MDESIEFLTKVKLRSKFLIAEFWIAMVSLSALLWLVILANGVPVSFLLLSFQLTIITTFGYLIYQTNSKLENVITVLDLISTDDPETADKIIKSVASLKSIWIDLSVEAMKQKAQIEIPRQKGYEQGQKE